MGALEFLFIIITLWCHPKVCDTDSGKTNSRSNKSSNEGTSYCTSYCFQNRVCPRRLVCLKWVVQEIKKLKFKTKSFVSKCSVDLILNWKCSLHQWQLVVFTLEATGKGHSWPKVYLLHFGSGSSGSMSMHWTSVPDIEKATWVSPGICHCVPSVLLIASGKTPMWTFI